MNRSKAALRNQVAVARLGCPRAYVIAFAGAAFAAGPPIKVGDNGDGKVLTNRHSMTRYTFAKDKSGKGEYTIITRTGGRSSGPLMESPFNRHRYQRIGANGTRIFCHRLAKAHALSGSVSRTK